MNLQDISNIQDKLEAFQEKVYDLKEKLIEGNSLTDSEPEELREKLSALNKLLITIISPELSTYRYTSMDLDNLFEFISSCSGYKKEELLNSRKNRKRELVQARQIHMSILNIVFSMSLAISGKIYYNKDHATVLHAKKTVGNLIETDQWFRKTYAPILIYFLKDKIARAKLMYEFDFTKFMIEFMPDER